MITRDFLIEEIWDNYGGADEGLSQAISFLRKALRNKKKEVIKTIPKKGYILKGMVLKDFQKPVVKTSIRKKEIFYPASGCLCHGHPCNSYAGPQRRRQQYK